MKLRSADLSWREIDGELVLLDLRSSQYLSANASGTVLIKELVEERTIDELASALVNAFGITSAQALTETDGFVKELRRGGLLEQV